MHQSKTGTPADGPEEQDQKKQYAWHRHPALIAAIPAVFTLIGGILAIVLGQKDVLPSAINPAPPPTTVLSTQMVTTTALSTVTETVTTTPSVDPAAATATPPANTGSVPVGAGAAGPLTVTVELGTGGKIGPSEWREGSAPGATADVFDATGRQLNHGCYPTWSLKRGQSVIQTFRGTACEGNGFTMFNFVKSLDPGTYHLTASVVTDGGAKGTGTANFTVS
ncbi:hypothetical protein ACQPYH_33595 [Kribbella sp. CA-245084]|uniref:hypothetical protein n=1 Tax=Kribbella sp. CA-245084 TaxID=3239940 RepID=UPI003D8A6967